MMNCDILVIGAGSLSRVFCYAITLALSESLKVCIIGRSKSLVDQVVTIANARSVAFSSTVTFMGDSIDWHSENDLIDKLATVYIHVPGPNGLPGGYPVVLQKGKVQIALPQGCTTAEAIELNRRAAIEDGVEVIDTEGFIHWAPRASEAIKQYAPSLAEGFRAEDLPIVCQEFIELRNRLRTE
ncbi:MAG: hypothetical protein F6K47_16475 [Symploca sp. SIO2E6]|nr:hypothetical protein [Symploca sp. SIO2E6]